MPGSGKRYRKEVRWMKDCAGTQQEYEVIEEGMNGRTTAFTDRIEPGTCALDYLYPCLISTISRLYHRYARNKRYKNKIWCECSRDWIWH